MTDVSIDMTANGFDASESFTLDRSIADETVPMADPGIDRVQVSHRLGRGRLLQYRAIADCVVACFTCGAWTQPAKPAGRFSISHCPSHAQKIGPAD